MIDSDIRKDFLCSKSFANASLQLCQAIADVAKVLCSEDVNPDCLTEFIACRLIPLDKGDTKEGKPGVRPMGDGEVLRRLIGKPVSRGYQRGHNNSGRAFADLLRTESRH